jgi:site-specific DNA-methyltransferase (adenine-specific)/modification methylase
MSPRIEKIGCATLYLGDCREILPALSGLDALVSDPPYGQNVKVNTFHAGGSREKLVKQRNGGSLKVRPKVHKPVAGDDKPFDPAHLLEVAPVAILWGAHKFADRLPRGSWLVWDKVPTGKVRDQGDGEAAWVSTPDLPLRMYRLLWDGLCVGKGARHEVTAGQQRLHPTQKPEALMVWTLNQLPIRSGMICDPYMGSGSTGVAAAKLGFGFVGIEIDPDHFDTACRRIEEAYRQGRLFDAEEPAAKPLQASMFGDAA